MVQHRGESDGVIEQRQADQGGQIFQFNIDGIPGEEGSSEEENELTPVFGTTGDNILEAGLDFDTSNNLIFTGDGNDLIDLSPGEGNNRAYGGDGSDVFILGESDRIFADDDDDRLFVLSGGDNVITGNSGADQFWIANGEYPESTNTITDFTADEDVIGISGLGIGFEDLTLIQDGDNTLIAVGDNNLAVLQGIDSSSLDVDNFAFA